MDIIVLCAIGAFALIGYYTGILKQVLRLGCLVAAYMFSGVVGRPIDLLFCARLGLSPSVSYAVSRCLGGIIAYIGASIAAEQIHRLLGTDETGALRPWNRKGGAALGAVKGLCLVLIVLFALDCFPEETMARWPRLQAQMQRSVCGRVASALNPLAGLPIVDDIRAVKQTASDPRLLERVREDPRVSRLLRHPKIAKVLRDHDVSEAIAERQFAKVLRNPNVKALVNDADVRRLIHDANLFDVVRSAAEQVKSFHVETSAQ